MEKIGFGIKNEVESKSITPDTVVRGETYIVIKKKVWDEIWDNADKRGLLFPQETGNCEYCGHGIILAWKHRTEIRTAECGIKLRHYDCQCNEALPTRSQRFLLGRKNENQQENQKEC